MIAEELPVVSFINVVKEHRDGRAIVRAIDQVSLDIAPGEMVAVTGRSGSGKSTLLNLAGGLDELTAGDVEIEGRSISKLTKTERSELRRRHVGYVFQSLNLVDSLTAEENVALPMEFDGISSAEAAEAAALALANVGIEELAGRFPDEMSGGERQRVAIARAIAGPRRVILADEPTGALDDLTARSVMSLLERLARQGTSILVVTHDLELAAFADRVVRLSDGKIEHISHRPAAPKSPADLFA